MRKKRLIIITVVSVLLIGTAVGGTFAAFRAGSSTEKTISTSTVDVKLHVDGKGTIKNGNIVYDYKDAKNDDVSEKVFASNEGTVDLYLRVKIKKEWLQNDKKITTRMNQNIDSDAIGITFANQQDWIIPTTTQESEDVYIYYKKKLRSDKPYNETSNFMDGFTLLKGISGNTNHYADLTAKLVLDAEAVQTVAADKVMLKEWGINAVFDDDGNIVSISNQ